jgi:hypothetical protein
MTTLTAYLALGLAICILVSLFYWQVFRPVVMQGLRYRLFALRDELRAKAIDGDEDCSSFAYAHLEGLICKSIAFVPTVSLATFLLYAIPLGDEDESPESLRFRQDASPALERIRDVCAQNAFLMMTVNSPLLMILATVIGSLLWISGTISRMMIIRRTESFVGGLGAPSGAVHSVA